MAMNQKIPNAYNLLLETLEVTIDTVKEFKDTNAENTDIRIQIGIIHNVIRSFEVLKNELVQIEKEESTSDKGFA
ncbi:MAG: hypothetical protein GOVbin655_41 [Prokaryotic dsDNA virus sp.]|nr:MAG: hypothetical protein GOVbin655_41 [Prokaryotic dsDNA virus sp.]|tara:strand:- start:2198 stop:2422 length:225 start_codon:yes stop_codon:yes gene_type:complete